MPGMNTGVNVSDPTAGAALAAAPDPGGFAGLRFGVTRALWQRHFHRVFVVARAVGP